MKKKIPLLVGGIIALFLGIVLGGAWRMFGTFILAANTIEKLEEGLYTLEYRGDYGFQEFLEQGGAESDSAVASYLTSYLSRGFYKGEETSDESRSEEKSSKEETAKEKNSKAEVSSFGCSAICTQDEEGSVFLGRNYDWGECRAILVHTVPQKGYESLSTCCLDFLGFGEDYDPEGSMMDRLMTLAAIYVPLDGMNEKGLMVADLMAGDKEETHQQSEKTDVTTTTAIRLLLDQAATVEEALELLKSVDMNSSIQSAHHLALADASGRSVVVEYVAGEMLVTPTQIVTNHYLSECDKQGTGSEQSHQRFEILQAWKGPAGREKVKTLLESVAQKNFPQGESCEKTMWSLIDRPGEGKVDFYFAENYRKGYVLSLGEKRGFVEERITE